MVGLVLVISALGACSKKASVEPRRPLDTTPAAGSVVVSDASAGYALSIPTSWKQMPTDVARFDGEADTLKAASPAPAKLTTGLTQLKSVVRNGASVAAIDPDTGATANLIVLDAGGQKATQIAVGSANQLRGNGATDITRQAVTVDGLAAVRQSFRTPFPGGTGPVSLAENQIYVVRRSQAFILTLTGDSSALDGIAASLKLA
ncbi:MAG: hypothetical protein DLM65_01490 [Candidatus Aeolococcus gillhamiae]|uniref:Uncharacterized protein n=1 Tax=Candidatus Aeolococcus gillhamiae TaxID=3127015 RepID=A0A2W5ZDW6_9BACT|nr:MAG: hypothetical protein DLM65_01490 [Candidatus Dormibacter sp. RRmetagenome_bin12]